MKIKKWNEKWKKNEKKVAFATFLRWSVPLCLGIIAPENCFKSSQINLPTDLHTHTKDFN